MSVSIEECPSSDKAPGLNRSKHTHLRSIIDRLVRIEEEKRTLSESTKEIFVEAKSGGFNGTAIRILVKEAIEDSEKRAKREEAEIEAELMRAALRENITNH